MTPKENDLYMEMMRLVAELGVQVKAIASDVKDLERDADGTVDRKGIKERITVAEYNINANKDAYANIERTVKEMNQSINKTIAESFIEVKAEFNKKIDALVETQGKQQTFITRLQPYINLIAWAVTFIGGFLLTQFLSGNLRIVSVP